MLHKLNVRKFNVYVENMLYLLTFIMPFAWRIATPLIYFTVILAIVDLIINQRRYKKLTFHGKLFIVWIFFSAISIFQSPKIAESFYNYRVLMAQYAGLYFVAYFYIDDTKKLKNIIYALVASGFFVAMYGVIQYIEGVSVLTGENKWVDLAEFPKLKERVFSTLANPNLLATFLITSICLSTGCLLDRVKNKKLRIAIYLSLVISCVCLLFTFSRGAWLTLFLIMCALGVLINTRILYALFALIGISMLTMREIILQRIISVFNQTDTSAALRWAYWDSTVQMIEWNHLYGIGWSAYQYVYPEYDYFINNPDIIIYHAHNMYLHMIAEIGIVGGLVYIAMFFYSIRWLYCQYIGATVNKGCIISVIAVVFAVLMMGVTDYPLFNIQLSCVFWLLMGSSFGALNDRK